MTAVFGAGCTATPANTDAPFATRDLPFADKSPLSAQAAAARWLADTPFPELPGKPGELRAALTFFVDHLRDLGATVEVNLTDSDLVYDGGPLPQHEGSKGVLDAVTGHLGLAYLATYTPRGEPLIRLYHASAPDQPSPLTLRPSGTPETITVRERESLISVSTRLAQEKGYRDVLFDFSPRARAPHSALAAQAQTLQGDGLAELLDHVTRTFSSHAGPFRFFEALADNGYVLVVTDRAFEPWQSLRVFNVTASTLSDNAERLTTFAGWKPANAEAWRLSRDFPIIAPYRIVIADIEQGFNRLFEPYPVQANLVQSSRSVFFVSRPTLDVSQRGPY